jgi:hypothetical protein
MDSCVCCPRNFSKQRQAIGGCEGGVIDFFKAMSEEMGEITIGEKDGFMTWSGAIKPANKPLKNPWWKFWGPKT